MAQLVCAVSKKALGAPDARKEWCQCVSEFGDLISKEVRENPRYNELDPKTARRRE